MQQALEGLDGIKEVAVDVEKGTARIVRERGKAETREMIKRINRAGFNASESQGQSAVEKEAIPVGSPVPGFEGLDAVIAGRQERIDIQKLLVPGVVTIVDFYADWCLPCKALDKEVKKILRQQPGVALRKIDIVDWETPVSAQCTEDFSMTALPYVRVYGKDGKFIEAIAGNDIEKIRAAVSKGINE